MMRTTRQWMTACLLVLAIPALADESDVDPGLREALKEAVSQSQSFSDRFEAEVWLMDMSSRLERWVPDKDKRLRMLRKVHAEAKQADLEPELVLAVIHVESRFDRFAISSVGARGLMQIMPFWLDEIGRPDDNLFHLDTNLRYGCTILRYYLDKENGNLSRALGRYNGSLGSNRYPSLVYSALANHWYRD
jgi:soluble lytic murein transglycosylase-like protein